MPRSRPGLPVISTEGRDLNPSSRRFLPAIAMTEWVDLAQSDGLTQSAETTQSVEWRMASGKVGIALQPGLKRIADPFGLVGAQPSAREFAAEAQAQLVNVIANVAQQFVCGVALS